MPVHVCVDKCFRWIFYNFWLKWFNNSALKYFVHHRMEKKEKKKEKKRKKDWFSWWKHDYFVKLWFISIQVFNERGFNLNLCLNKLNRIQYFSFSFSFFLIIKLMDGFGRWYFKSIILLLFLFEQNFHNSHHHLLLLRACLV